METLNQETQAEVAPVEEKMNWGRFLLDVVETVVLAVVLFVGINAVSARVRVDGFSMRPTLEDGEFLLVDKVSYFLGEVKRGDIIVFHFPLNPDEELIKRVIGLPGDQIVVQDSQVFVNGQMLNEPYIAQPPLYNGDWMVADGHLFVLGDNRNNSNDSKDWGMLPAENVVGKAVLIYWPPPMWDVLEHPEVIASQ
ncbi:MAG TPA: signal peptidase I [Anaerolineales bacterium]|nr:signal peptidase I [Anaerolineae bacterium]HRJ59096.1 signal peptidase I [Anaerolineales bacterium]HRK91421.1 signal peptidase I [Anaerolineales bacterium]